MSQKGLLKYAAVNKERKRAGKNEQDSDDSDDDIDYSKFVSRANSNAEMARRIKQLEELKAQGKDIISDAGGNRLPNRVQKGSANFGVCEQRKFVLSKTACILCHLEN